MYLVKELERLQKVAVAAGDHLLVADISRDLVFAREAISRLQWYEDRGTQSLLYKRLSEMDNGSIKEALKELKQSVFDGTL